MPTDRDAAARAVLAASRALVAMAAQSLEQAPVEVTLSQWRALVVVHTRGAQRMSELAAESGLSPSSTSRLVERLERKELVLRRSSVSSRREVEVHLTGAGSSLVVGVLAHRLGVIDGVLASMPAERWEDLRAAFADFAVAAGEPLDAPEPA